MPHRSPHRSLTQPLVLVAVAALLLALLPSASSAGTVEWDDLIGTWEVVADNDADHTVELVVIEVSASGTDSAGRTAYTGVVVDARYSECLRDGQVVWPVIERRGTRVGSYTVEDGLDGACEVISSRALEARTSPGMFDSLNYGNTWQLFPGTGNGDDPDDIRGVYASQRSPSVTVEVTGQAPRYAGEVVAVEEGSCYAVGQQVWPDIRFGRGSDGGQYGATSVTWGPDCLTDQPVSLQLTRDDQGAVTRLRVDRGADVRPEPRLDDYSRVGDLEVDQPAEDDAPDQQLSRFRGTYTRGLTGRDRVEIVPSGTSMEILVFGDRCVPDGTRIGVLRDAVPDDDGTVTATAEFDVVVVPQGGAECRSAESTQVAVRLSDQVFTAENDPSDRTRFADVLLSLPRNDHLPQTIVRPLSLLDYADPESGDSFATRLDFFYDLVLGGPPSGTDASFAQAEGLPVYLGTAGDFPDGLALAGVAGATRGVTVLLDPQDRASNQAVVDGLDVAVSTYVIAGGQAAVPDAALPDLGGTPMERVAGANRFDTAARLSARTFSPGVDVVYVATGANFPDALSGGAQASRDGAPVLLVDGARMPAETDAELRRLAPSRIVALGGEAVIPASMVEQLRGYAPAVERLAGPSRFDTAIEVSRASAGAARGLFLTAPGGTFPDALVLASLAWYFDGPLLLVPDGAIPNAVLGEVERLQASTALHLGPPGSLSSAAQGQLAPLFVDG